MKKILCVLTSGRKKGFTSNLLETTETILTDKGYQVERLNLQDYSFVPCRSCFVCIKKEPHVCPINDEFGKNGCGEIYKKIKQCDGIVVADPVHSFGATATCHLFFERCYPFMWNGEIKGKPLVSISCAGNQGMETFAMQDICKLAFSRGYNYVGGIATHMFERSIVEDKILCLVEDFSRAIQSEDIKKSFDDVTKLKTYLTAPYCAYDYFIEYLTDNSEDENDFRISKAIELNKECVTVEIQELLLKAQEFLRNAVSAKKAGDVDESIENLANASRFWANATWKMFLGKELNMESPPKSYKAITK